MQPEHITGKQVLYGCLDWGSGHIARSVPLILQLQRQANHVVFIGSPEQYGILKQYGFTGTFGELPATGFQFKGDGNFTKEGLRNVLTLRKAVRRDRERVEDYIAKHHIDLVISDHRYGVVSGSVPSVFVTHQVSLPPKTNWLAKSIHRAWMNRFGTIWIMDNEQERLAGDLGKRLPNAVYIGHYSRFSPQVPAPGSSGNIVAVISGPEPYARQLFDTVYALAMKSNRKWTIICSGAYTEGNHGHIQIIRSDWKAADQAIQQADLVISRNGYSTLMDLKILNKKAIFLPTPGQPEQLYLKEINVNPDWHYADSIESLEQLSSDSSQR